MKNRIKPTQQMNIQKVKYLGPALPILDAKLFSRNVAQHGKAVLCLFKCEGAIKTFCP